MDISNAELKRKIDALKDAFIAGLEARLVEIEGAQARLGADMPSVEQANSLRTILEQAHKIAGSAGTFGFGEMGMTASEIERLCDLIIKGKHEADAETLAELSGKIVALRAEATS